MSGSTQQYSTPHNGQNGVTTKPNRLSMSTKLDPKDIDAAFAAAPLALRVERTDADKKITKKFLLHNLDYYSMHRKCPSIGCKEY